MNKFYVGDCIVGRVISISKTHMLMAFADGWKGIVHISEISDFLVSNISTFFKKGQKVAVKVIVVIEEKKFLELSFKEIHPRFLKQPFEFDIKETEKGFNNLLKLTLEKVNND